jgi:hypothetical protein
MAEESGLPNLDGLVDKLVENIFEPSKLTRLQNAMRNAQAEATTVASGAEVKAVKTVTANQRTMQEELESVLAGVASWIMATAVETSFNVNVDQSQFYKIGASQGREAVSRLIAAKMVESLTGGSTSIEASPVPAARYLDVVIGQAFESWAVGAMVEIGSAAIPFIEQIQTVGDIGNRIVNALGIGDSSSRVLRPYIDTLVVEPLRRYIATTYRPNLLSESMAVRQYLRGAWTRERLDSELAVQGWSAERIEAQINNAQKTITIDDALTFAYEGSWGFDRVVKLAMDLGYPEEAARDLIQVDGLKRSQAVLARPTASVMRAYADRDIDDAELDRQLRAASVPEPELLYWKASARTERALNVKRLSHGEILDCVELEILTTGDYRRWLELEGYNERDRFALELRLRVRLQKERDVEAERKRMADERAAEKALKAAATAQRKAELEDDRRLHRRGPLSDLERAAIRGLIPLARVEEVLGTQYDGDTVAILLELVEGDRVAYVAQQQRAADALQRAGVRRIDVGDLEAAVMADVLTLADYRQGLRSRGFDAADTEILTATLAARKADIDDARAKRAAAEQEATRRSIDLGRFERLVRRGVRTFAQYDALLSSLGFDDGSRAAMADLLRLDIADDEAARALRNAPKPAPAPKELTLEQARRAVLLGLLSDDAFQTYLVKAGYTSDAQRVLLAELRRDVVDADAARRKREDAEAASAVVALPLSRLARAARLGIVSPAAYQARLVDDGYTADDVAVEIELLLVEIADERAAQLRRDDLAAAVTEPQALTLQQIERAVKAGTQSINDYRFALAQVYAPDDADVLARTLEAELDTLNDARSRRVTIEGELAARTLSIGDLEAGVKAGALTFERYRDQLIRWGYGRDDAELLTALLVEKLNAAPAGDGNG